MLDNNTLLDQFLTAAVPLVAAAAASATVTPGAQTTVRIFPDPIRIEVARRQRDSQVHVYEAQDIGCERESGVVAACAEYVKGSLGLQPDRTEGHRIGTGEQPDPGTLEANVLFERRVLAGAGFFQPVSRLGHLTVGQ